MIAISPEYIVVPLAPVASLALDTTRRSRSRLFNDVSSREVSVASGHIKIHLT